jgi:DNA-binding transcriptional LysR family regulator
MPFHIRQLLYAIAAADHGSFYRAARALNRNGAPDTIRTCGLHLPRHD